MIECDKATTKLAHMNVRAEMHGEESVTAIDLKFVTRQANTWLDMFHPALRGTLFAKTSGAAMEQGDLLGATHLPALRFPYMNTISWDHTFEGYTVHIESEFKRLDITVSEAKVDKFKFTPQEGGTVETAYRVRFVPTPDQIAALAPHLNGEVKVSLIPPKSDGSGASKIKDESVRAANREAGQDDILDLQERERQEQEDAQREVERANAMEDALRNAGDGAVDAGEKPEEGAAPAEPARVTLTYLDPPEGDNDEPETSVLVELLAQRGYTMTEKQIEDANVVIDDDFADLLEYLRGSPNVPKFLKGFKTPAPKAETKPKLRAVPDAEQVETEPVTLDPPKPAAKTAAKKQTRQRRGGAVE